MSGLSKQEGVTKTEDRSAGSFVLDRDSVRAVDRAAVEAFGIPSIVLMENAARGLAEEAKRMLEGAPTPHALIVCGSGNNGGDGYALARHLHNAGIDISIVALGDPKAGSDAATNCRICRAIGIREIPLEELGQAPDADLIVDAIFGTGLDRPVSGPAARAIEWINAADRPVLAVDIPSGLDCNTGRTLGVAVRAVKTVSFVGLKPGFFEASARDLVGEVVVADIGAPIELVRRYGRPVEPHEQRE